MKWLVLLAAVPSFLIAFGATPWIRRAAANQGLVDRPDARKRHNAPTPLGGGIAIWLGVVVTFAVIIAFGLSVRWESLLSPSSVVNLIATHWPGVVARLGQLSTLLAAGTAMMLLGLADDLWSLDWRVRLMAQTLVAVVIVSLGWRMSVFIDAPVLTFTLSVIWIVAIVNAFNMLDNMDGLSAGVALIASAVLAVAMLTAPDPITNEPQLFVAGFLAVISGSIAGFLWHNSPPASIFMGDAGSYLIGFLLATSTLMATFTGGDTPRHAILAPLCVLAVPIYDMVTVLTIRIREGRSPFAADRSHFSHRLVELGLSRRATIWTIYLLTLTCGLGALLLHQVDRFGAVVVLIMVGCVLIVVAVLETAGRGRE